MLLPATRGAPVDVSKIETRTVIFCYPWSGRPGVDNPPDWEAIPGAHGSTPQALAYAASQAEFRALGVDLFGLSFQDTGWQREFAERCRLTFPLLSDATRA